jgi:hypothetical protein
MCSTHPKDICQNISRGAQGHPGGPNGPAAVLQDTWGGAKWKCAVSQNPAALDQIFCRTPYAIISRDQPQELASAASDANAVRCPVVALSTLVTNMQSMTRTNALSEARWSTYMRSAGLLWQGPGSGYKVAWIEFTSGLLAPPRRTSHL